MAVVDEWLMEFNTGKIDAGELRERLKEHVEDAGERARQRVPSDNFTPRRIETVVEKLRIL